MRLLDIGGNGHYGGLITEHLAAKHEITIFDLHERARDFECAQVVGDIMNLDEIDRAAEGIDAIVTFFVGDASLSTMGIVNVMTAAEQRGVAHVVYTSSGGMTFPIDTYESDHPLFPMGGFSEAFWRNYFPITEKLDGEIQKAEDFVFKNPNSVLLNKIFDLKENVLILRRIIGPQRETMNFIARGGYDPIIPADLSIYFRDVSDLLARISDNLDTYRDMLTSALDGYVSSTSNKLNEIMKVLTIIATIMMPLTLITGIYGMNFRYIPEVQWRYGYFVVIGIMIFLACCMLLFFKKKKWL